MTYPPNTFLQLTTTYPPNISFDRTTNNESLEELITKDNSQTYALGQESLLSRRSVRSLTLHALLLILASVFFVLWINAEDTSCPLDPLLTYSPVNEAVQYVEKQFDGRINSTSPFRGYLSPEIDAAWASVSIDAKATRLDHQQFLMIGGNDTTAAIKYLPEDGGGYMSQVDGYHHLHCLDMLRKYLRPDYYWATLDVSFNSNIRPHLGHCVEIVRQKLMCTSDLTMISYDWIPGFDHPQPNLSAMHQCVDYERILDWSDKHNAHVLKGHVVKFGEATELAADPM